MRSVLERRMTALYTSLSLRGAALSVSGKGTVRLNQEEDKSELVQLSVTRISQARQCSYDRSDSACWNHRRNTS